MRHVPWSLPRVPRCRAGGSLVQPTDTEATGVVTRGDWTQPETAAAAGRVVESMTGWLNKHFEGEKI